MVWISSACSVILDVLKDVLLRKEYDETFDNGGVIEKLDAQVCVLM